MAKRAYDGKILRNLALNSSIPTPMRGLLMFLVAASHNSAYTYAANKTILRQAGIGNNNLVDVGVVDDGR